MSIGNRIRETRESAGLKLKHFAERIGISDSAVSQMENGKSGVSDQTIRSICREFHVSETWLRTGMGDMYANTRRKEEMGELVGKLMSDRPDSFRSALVTTLLRLDPEGPEWAAIERIYNDIAAEQKNQEP